MALKLPKAMIEEMIAHAREDLPNEACGVGVCHDDGEPGKWE